MCTYMFNFNNVKTRDSRVPEPKRTPLGYILPYLLYFFDCYRLFSIFIINYTE
jgi:hypothetical protein